MNIIVDSTFNPFSYRDLMQPIYDYKQAYEETEAAYSDLVTQTEAWKDIANRENSPEAYAMYKSYSDQLNAIVDDFSQGMNPRNRRQLLGMKRRYASEITPIARASEAMQAANALRDQAGPDAIFEVGRYSSIDDFLHGKTANNKFESRKDIAARTAALAQATAQSILEDPIIKQSMSPQFLEVIQKRGLGSLEELQAAIASNPAAVNRFAQVRNQMINQVGGLDRFDAAGRTAIEGAINEGLYAGLNSYQTSLQQNGEYRSAAERDASARAWKSLQLQESQMNKAAAASAPRAITDNDGNPTGTFYDPKINMVVDKDGNIIGDPTKIGTGNTRKNPRAADPTSDINLLSRQDRTARLKVVAKPLYFDAGGLHGDSAHRDQVLTAWSGGSKEGHEHSFGLLHGKAKNRALDYIGNLVGQSNYSQTYANLPPEMKSIVDQTLSQYVKVWRDQDWLSDNHFAVYLSGADHLDPDNYNETDVVASLKALQTAIGGSGNYNNVAPGKRQ